jgi:hypothetical protein
VQDIYCRRVYMSSSRTEEIGGEENIFTSIKKRMLREGTHQALHT